MFLPRDKKRLVSVLRTRMKLRAPIGKLPKGPIFIRSKHGYVVSIPKGRSSVVSIGPDNEVCAFDTLFEHIMATSESESPPESPIEGKPGIEALLTDPIEWMSASKSTKSIGAGVHLIKTPSTSVRKFANGAPSPLKRRKPTRISSNWPFDSLKTKGMSRPSMTCYRRSSFQALLHAPVFLNWIKHHDSGNPDDAIAPSPNHHCRSNKPPAGCLACGLKKLAAFYWTSSRDTRLINSSAVAIDRTIHTLGSRPNFMLSTRSIHEQGDPMEFINWILSYFDTFTPSPMPIKQLHTLFRLELNVRRVCQSCGAREEPGRSQISFNISLGLARARGKPFKRHLFNFFNDEGTPGECAKCSSKHQMPEELRIHSAPEVLFIHIDRNFYGRQKIRDPVDFPHVLDLTRYKSGNFAGPEGPLLYAIGSVISHQGGIHGGHYVSTNKSPAGVFFANDETVRAADFVETKGNPRFPYEPVVLMYLKK